MNERYDGETAIHRMVARCRAGAYPARVAQLESGWVVMGERQVLQGYCLLLPDPVVPHLNCLPQAARGVFLADMARLGDAILLCTDAVRINYALFGNVEPALHAHVFPRLTSESVSDQRAQPWALDWDRAPLYAEERHGALRRRIAASLAQ